MRRRDFIKGAGGLGLLATLGPAFEARARAAEPRGPMGRPLKAGETLLVRNAKPVDVKTGKLFKETAILIRGGKIEKLLSDDIAADLKIDAGGRYVIPGLINNHCHMSMPGVAAASLSLVKNAGKQIDRNCVDCILHGVTTVRDQLGRQSSLLNRQQLIARGDLMGPRILHAIGVDVPHGYLNMLSAVMKGGAIIASNVAEARDAVARAVDLGTDHIKVAMQYKSLFQDEKPIPMLSDEMFAAVVEKAASLGKTVAVHHTSLEGFRRALKAGIQSFEHMPSDLHLTDEDVRQFIEKRRAVVPTGSVAWALAFPLTGDENFNSPFVQKIWKDKEARINSVLDEYALPPLAKVGKKVYRNYTSPGYFDKKHRMITPSAGFFNAAGAIGGANMMKMYNAGCRIGCGNDGGIPFVWPGALPLEMILNQEAGMKPADVLRSATAVNSEIIGMGKSLGTLDPGKIADMVFLDANPLENMENMLSTAGVLQAGRLVYTKGKLKTE